MRYRGNAILNLGAGLCVGVTASVAAQSPEKPWQHADGSVEFKGQTFENWRAFHRSGLFDPNHKCLTPSPDAAPGGPEDQAPFGFRGISPADCSLGNTSISGTYDPSVAIYRIPCVVHVITDASGSQGNISDAQVESGIRILNEDMNALLGTPGGNGTEARIEFYLADVDPQGNATNGITRSANSTWFNDGGNYWDSLAWDTNRYCNIYTNTASGALGYVNGFPAEPGHVGAVDDRIVVLWSTYGEDGPYGPPYDMGRTLTHEVGHYLGLYHTFQGGCAGGSCYGAGDLICDTNDESGPNFSCDGGNPSTCGSLDPIDNYMDYSDDSCMARFTVEQINRMRCTLLNYRPLLYSSGPGCPAGCSGDILNDGVVDSADLGVLFAAWGPCSDDPEQPCCSDFDGNDIVDSSDVGLLIAAWGPCPVDPCEGVDCNDGDPCTIDTCVDGTCINEPVPGCGEGPCGDPNAGSCFTANGTPGCDDAAVCEPICAADPYCCDTAWDGVCCDATGQCGDGGGGSGDCCISNGSPGCEESECQALICGADAYCCDTEWDQICADAALANCPVCNS